VLERLAFRPLRGRADSNISGLISSLAMATVFEAIALQIFGPDISRFPQGTFSDRMVQIGGAQASLLQLCIVGISVVLMALLTLLLTRTRLGRRIRAVAESPRAARILGVDVDRTIAMAFFLSSALGGAAGVLFGLAFNSISPDVGRSVELKGLAVIILGGMGSVPGAVIAGFALGLIEVFTVAHIGSSFRDAVSFAVLFLVLIARPRGLFGRAAAREA
jgi:branched-chain amino acid transport system permease protein